MLSGAQLGITVTGLMVGYVAERLVGQSLGTLLGGVGIEPAVSISVGTVLALAISTIVQTIFGELYPKNLAIANAGPMARGLLARSTNVYLAIFGWLITIFDHAANLLLRMVGVKPVQDADSSATASDLKRIVADSRHSEHLDDDLSVLIDRILAYPERDVEHAVMPWSSIDVIRPEATIAEVRTMMATAHTRYPVLDEDNIPVGVVHLLDVLATDNRSDPVTVPPVMMLPQAQARMVQAGSKVACVVDEYGRLDGIVTLEDLAEEVVGELTDEHDLEVPELIQEHGHASWRISGDAPIDEVEREIGHELPRGDFETISGMLIDHLKDLSEGPSKHSHPTATVAV